MTYGWGRAGAPRILLLQVKPTVKNKKGQYKIDNGRHNRREQGRGDKIKGTVPSEGGEQLLPNVKILLINMEPTPLFDRSGAVFGEAQSKTPLTYIR